MNIRAVRTTVFKEGEDLVLFLSDHMPRLKDDSIVVVASKVVALAEGRVAMAKTKKEFGKLVRSESEWIQKTKLGNLALKDGILMWNAGIDSSNADGKLVLLPKDSYAAADTLRKTLKKHYKIKNLGIILSDSRVMPLRAGVVGIALGYAGFKGTRDYRGKKDMFGKKLKYTQTDIADALATAAIIEMGEGNEQKPFCVIEDASVEFCERVKRNEMLVAPEDDMYRPLFKLPKKRKRSR
ncbi:MAG: coenzyme F420-0:L-glutamate ligase [Candidatus Paceibacterota bacterium]